ncbi:hypothetical protein [Rhodococcus jostii]|uniref:hypothetical protein n=1 Tax=Rhodococcus jostii TaxID=132919 RepID=UPI001F07C975|nr:hypothetical protein [Rhodococcus jostii]
MRSPDTADLASGYANVVVLSPWGGRGRTPPEAGHVEVITPDADSRAALGTNLMDLATRIPAARAGFAQGKQEAIRVTFL